MLVLLFLGLLVVTLLVAYIGWIRPALKVQPTFASYYAKEDSLWAALSAKFAGLKQKLVTAAVLIMGFVVSAYDVIISATQASGFDWGNVSTLTSKVPAWAWPLIGMALIKLVQYFRDLGERRTIDALEQQGIDPTPIVGAVAAKGG